MPNLRVTTPLETLEPGNSLRLGANGAATSEGRSRRLQVVHAQVDRVGTWLSFLCAIHCLAMPLLLGLLPLIGLGMLLNHTAESIFIGCSVTLALLSVTYGYHSHRRLSVFAALAFAVASLLLGLHAESGHAPLIVVGALGISLTHLINRRLCNSCPKCQH